MEWAIYVYDDESKYFFDNEKKFLKKIISLTEKECGFSIFRNIKVFK